MVAVKGTYQNGFVKLEKEYKSDKPVKVIITFLEEVEESYHKKLSLSDFSFMRSKNALKDFKGSFSDALIEERRNEL